MTISLQEPVSVADLLPPPRPPRYRKIMKDLFQLDRLKAGLALEDFVYFARVNAQMARYIKELGIEDVGHPDIRAVAGGPRTFLTEQALSRYGHYVDDAFSALGERTLRIRPSGENRTRIGFPNWADCEPVHFSMPGDSHYVFARDTDLRYALGQARVARREARADGVMTHPAYGGFFPYLRWLTAAVDLRDALEPYRNKAIRNDPGSIGPRLNSADDLDFAVERVHALPGTAVFISAS